MLLGMISVSSFLALWDCPGPFLTQGEEGIGGSEKRQLVLCPTLMHTLLVFVHELDD